MSLYLRRNVVWSAVPEAFAGVHTPHCTIAYSQTLGPEEVFTSTCPLVRQVIGVTSFKTQPTSLRPHQRASVCLLDDWDNTLHARWRWLVAQGATWDLPDDMYQPHVTFGYQPEDDDTPAVLHPHKFWVVLGPEIASELPVNHSQEFAVGALSEPI